MSKFTYGYDALSRITEWGQQQDPSAAEPTPFRMKYDRAGRLLQAVKQVDEDTGTDWAWRYDRAGNRLNEQVEQFASTGASVARKSYGINTGDQITSSAAGGPLHVTGELDAQGRILQAGPVAAALTEADNSFAAWIDPTTSAAATLVSTDMAGQNTSSSVVLVDPAPVPTRSNITYDLNGNLLQYVLTAADGVTTSLVKYEWDVLNRLVATETVGQRRSEFGYDGLGRRVSITEKDGAGSVTGVRYFLWDGLQIVEERTTPGGTPTKQFFTQGEARGSTLYYYTRDHLGSLREVTDASGNVVARFEYDPYGQATQTVGTGSAEFDFLYTGHMYHEGSGLYLAPYRAYDPGVGRWISRDPIGHKGGINVYVYVNGDPIKYLDILGLEGWQTGPGDPWYGIPIHNIAPNGDVIPNVPMVPSGGFIYLGAEAKLMGCKAEGLGILGYDGMDGLYTGGLVGVKPPRGGYTPGYEWFGKDDPANGYIGFLGGDSAGMYHTEHGGFGVFLDLSNLSGKGLVQGTRKYCVKKFPKLDKYLPNVDGSFGFGFDWTLK